MINLIKNMVISMKKTFAFIFLNVVFHTLWFGLINLYEMNVTAQFVLLATLFTLVLSGIMVMIECSVFDA
jgi:hypothetical protein